MNTYVRTDTANKSGLTLIEVAIAALILGLLSVGWFQVLSQANRQNMDTYYEFLASQLAAEPLEVFRALGYSTLERVVANALSIPEYPLGVSDIGTHAAGEIQALGESFLFRREILMKPVAESGNAGMMITVRVYPREDEGRLKTWWRQREVKMEAVVWRLPP